MKVCTKCKVTKEFTEFYKDKGRKDNRGPSCKSCEKERKKKIKPPSKEKRKEYRERFTSKNPGYGAAKLKEFRENNPDKLKQYEETFKIKNPGAGMAKCAKRRAFKKNATPTWSDADKIKNIYKKADLLNKSSKEKYDVDHIIPLQGKTVCGLHIHTNLQIITKKENQSKGNKLT